MYNAQGTLNEALESVSAQTYREFEVIIINDGSTDRSPEIIKQWKQDNPSLEIEVISQKNHGLGNARNQGLRRASHAWLALLDADDIWEPQKLQVIADTIGQNPGDMYYHCVKTFGLSTSRIRSCPRISSIKDILLKGNPILPSAVAGKTSLFQKYGFSENPAFHGAEDLHLWIMMLNDEVIFEKVNEVLTHYRESGGMSTDIEVHIENVIHVLEHFYRKEMITPTLLAQAKKRKYLEIARFYHKRRQFDHANRFYIMADLKSLKILGLRTLSFLGVPV